MWISKGGGEAGEPPRQKRVLVMRVLKVVGCGTICLSLDFVNDIF